MPERLQDKYKRILIARGSTEIAGKSSKRIVLTDPGRPGQFYYLGKAGSVRRGATIKGSVPVKLVEE